MSAALAAAQAVLINAGGATFPYPLYSKWFDVYHKQFPNIQINYQSQGSGFGIQQITMGTVDFGASDMPMTDKQLQEFRNKHGYGVLHFPTALGANVPAYNIPGITQSLNFTPQALVGIFLGTITKWNDPELVQANPGIKLPTHDVLVIHRSEGSGTTYIWTDYLSKVSPEWKAKVGRGTSVNWPIGLGAKGNEAVGGQIRQIPYSMGYLELTYAVQIKMVYGSVRNAAGKFVRADMESVNAAGAAKPISDDFRISITDAPGEASYPITGFTWLLVPERIADTSKRNAIVEFLKWMLTEGQNQTEALAYVRLPKAIVDRETKLIGRIQ